jgi:hypothetical protein
LTPFFSRLILPPPMNLPEFPKIPVYTIHHTANIELATPDRPNGGVDDALFNATIAFESGEHSLRILKAPRGHTKNEHNVGWFDFKGDTPNEWKENSWEILANDTEFLTKLEEYVEGLQSQNPYIRAYFMIGFATEQDSTDFTYKRGLQSIKRGHIHLVNTKNGDPPDRYLSPDDDKDCRMLVVFLNNAGEQSIVDNKELFEHFGKPIIITQEIDLPSGEIYHLNRTFFGFESVKDALPKSLDLIHEVKESWLPHAQTLAEQWITIGQNKFPQKTTPVPGVSITFPSPIDRKNHTIPDEYKVIVQPLPVHGPLHVFETKGYTIDWIADEQGDQIVKTYNNCDENNKQHIDKL